MGAAPRTIAGSVVARACLALALILCGSVAWAASSATVGVGLIAVRFGAAPGSTRLVLDLDATVNGRFLAAESSPTQMVFALPALLSSGAMAGRGQGLVEGWSIVDGDRGARLILRVAPGAVVSHRFLIPPETAEGHWRYVIDISQGDPLAALVAGAQPGLAPPPRRESAPPLAAAAATTPILVAAATSPAATRASYSASKAAVATPASKPAASAAAAAPQSTPSTAPLLLASTATPPAASALPAREPPAPPATAAGGPAQTRPATVTPRPVVVARATTSSRPATKGAGGKPKVVVVDAGHGGHDPGARSLVRNEKDLNLAAALELKARLEKLGRYKVVLTRDSDVFIPLEARVQIARRAGADLFISLHSDSAGSDPTPHGASVYTLSDSGQRRVNYVLGPHEWFTHEGDRRTDPGVGQILLDLTQRSTRNRSAQFASLLINHIGDRVDLLPRSRRDAGYFVLLAPDVPAVLLEMGFITNPSDEMRLTDPTQRGRLMAGVADAIDSYFYGETHLAAGL